MANAQKPAANISALPPAGAEQKATTRENSNIQPRSSMAAKPTSALKPLQTQASLPNGAKVSEMGDAKDAESAKLVAKL